jgi:hypothetical protein
LTRFVGADSRSNAANRQLNKMGFHLSESAQAIRRQRLSMPSRGQGRLLWPRLADDHAQDAVPGHQPIGAAVG